MAKRAPGRGGHRIPKTGLRGPGGQYVAFGILWTGLEVLANNINRHGTTLNLTRRAAMERLAEEMLEYMQDHAPWNDRTGDARAMLQAVAIHDERAQSSTVWAAHGAEYGIYLEIYNAGELAIIAPTIEVFSSRMISTVNELEDAFDVLERAY